MAKLTEKIINEAKLDELNIQPKQLIGQGKEHDVYNMKRMPGYVVKQKHYDNENEDEPRYEGIADLARAYEKAPHLVARVARRGRDWAVVERVDAQRAKKEIERIAADINMDEETLLYAMAKVSKALRVDMISKATGPNKDLLRKYMEFVDMVNRDLGDEVDLYYENIGYDSNGNLKLIDL